MKRDLTENSLFDKVKPSCITVSRHALSTKSLKLDQVSEVALALNAIKQALCKAENETIENDKNQVSSAVADYVFFPISHLLLRHSTELTDQIWEHVFVIIRQLIKNGWAQTVSTELFLQLLGLVSRFLPYGEPSKKANGGLQDIRLSENSIFSVCLCLETLLIVAVKNAVQDLKFEDCFSDLSTRPRFFACALALLELLENEEHLGIRITCCNALKLLLFDIVHEPSSLAACLPRTVSVINKCLVAKPLIHHSLIIGFLDILEQLLLNVLDDRVLEASFSASGHAISDQALNSSPFIVEQTPSWLRATASQLKCALEVIYGLRFHERQTVRLIFVQLSSNLLAYCTSSLKESLHVILHTLIALSCDKSDEVSTAASTNLKRAINDACCENEVRCYLRKTMYDWIDALPDIIYSRDNDEKRRRLSELQFLMQLTPDFEQNQSNLWKNNLIKHLLNDIKLRPVTIMDQPNSLELINEIKNINTDNYQLDFQSPFLYHNEYQDLAASIKSFLKALGTMPFANDLLHSLVEVVATTGWKEDINPLWITTQMMKGMLRNFPLTPIKSDLVENVAQEIFSVSSNWLDDENLYLMQSSTQSYFAVCVALEAIAISSQVLRTKLRSSLFHLLYVIIHSMGHQNLMVRSYASRCLKIVAHNLAYKDSNDIIAQNADYLINSILLRIDSFDITPGLLTTLVVIIRITGSKIIDYLDDVIDSLFDIVDRFHYYSNFTEGVILVFGEVIEELYELIDVEDIKSLPEKPSPTIEKIGLEIKQRSLKWDDAIESHIALSSSTTKVLSEAKPTIQLSRKVQRFLAQFAKRVSVLLSHPSEKLRFNLLNMLIRVNQLLKYVERSTKLDAPSPKEDEPVEFFNLVHKCWPALVMRLSDPSEPVINAALRNISQLCILCTGFLASRMKKDAWIMLLRLLNNDLAQHRLSDHNGPIYEAIANTFIYCSPDFYMYREVVGLLQRNGDPPYPGVQVIKSALKLVNGDAYWLYFDNKSSLIKPQDDKFKFRDI